jgi:hypothetical protein
MTAKTTLLLALILPACQARVQSQLVVNGTPFVASSCASGAPFGYSGVELADAAGQRLRLSSALDGRFSGAYFAPGENLGDALEACGSFRLERGTGVINGVRNLDGEAVLSCATARGHRIQGSVRFENCH